MPRLRTVQCLEKTHEFPLGFYLFHVPKKTWESCSHLEILSITTAKYIMYSNVNANYIVFRCVNN